MISGTDYEQDITIKLMESKRAMAQTVGAANEFARARGMSFPHKASDFDTNDTVFDQAVKEIYRLRSLLQDCHNAALPDPNDEREVSGKWLAAHILEITRQR